MRRASAAPRWLLLLPCFIALASVSAPAPAAARPTPPLARGPQVSEGPFSYDRAQDLGALWRDALEAGWGEEDAVVLLERHEETWTSDGRRVESHHRVVRIATDLAVEHYADLRVPYDSLFATLTVLALRTFRDGQWIESGATAQVEMMPFGLDRAPDYASQRERMLMHDGVEVPCVVETAWKIEDRFAARRGIWGLEVFRQVDPVVRAEFALYSSGRPVRAEGRNGAGEGEDVRETDPVRYGQRWRFERLAPVVDLGPDPGADLACVEWSSFADWAELGEQLRHGFEQSCCFTQAHRDTLKNRLRGAGSETERARRVAALVADKTRLVELPEGWSLRDPRDGARTYGTAYGTAMDRAALAAGFFREAGLAAEPCYAGRSFLAATSGAPTTSPPPKVPALDRFGPLLLLVHDRPGDEAPPLGLYDPAASTFTAGLSGLAGRAVWRAARPDLPPAPAPIPGGNSLNPGAVGRVSLSLDLRRDEEAKSWVGTGTYSAEGLLCPFGRMEGLGGQCLDFLGGVVSSVVAKAEVTAYNPSAFEDGRVLVGLEVKAAAPEDDSKERVRLILGGLDTGVRSLLPGDLALYRASVDRNVLLPGALEQVLQVRLILPEAETIRLPEPLTLENHAGRFSLRVERDGDAVTVTRGLFIGGDALAASTWPELRALLLAEEHDRNRVVLYKPGGED